MEPLVSQVVTRARNNYLGAGVSVFSDPYMLGHVQAAFEEMESVFKTHQLPDVMVITAPYHVNGGDGGIDPVAAGWTGFGDIELLEERIAGSTDAYTPMRLVDILSQRDSSDKIREYTHNQGQIQFVAPIAAVDVRAHYFSSGNGSTLVSGSTILVDDCLNFLAAAAAASAGGPKGYTEEAQDARNKAYGPNNPNPLAILGGSLQALVESKLRVLQQTPVVPSRYRAGGFR